MQQDPKIVLLIARDIDTGDSIRTSLEQSGEAYHVVHETELHDGLERMAGGGVDLVLLDLDSPDGGDLLEPLTQVLGRDASVPVIVLSELDDPAAAARAVSLGAQDYLVKGKINGGVIVRVARYAVERNRILARLRELDQLKSEFLSTASHEMRTPLAIIREFTCLVRDGVAGPVNTEQQDCLDATLRNCDRLTGLIEDLLDLSRIESGKLKLSRARTDLIALLNQCQEDFLQRFESRGQDLVLRVDAGLPAALCDGDKIVQVLINLVGNALKFTDTGGRVTIRASREDDFVRVDVEDEGVGIAFDEQSKIFDAFVQIGRTDGPGARGTGLGLTISRSIVMQHGGNISVESEPGCGSRFSFTVPVYHEGTEFDAFVDDRRRIYRARNRVATLVLLRPAADDSAKIDLLERIRSRAEDTLRGRKDEMLLVESKGILACLLESDRTGTLSALGRLRGTLPAIGIRPEEIEFALVVLRPTEARENPVDPREIPFESLAQRPERSRAGRQVLIVDDDEMVLGLVADILRRSGLGLEVETTMSGYDACVRFGEHEPDLVILDLHMPGVDGVQALASMLHARRRQARFLAISGHPERFEEVLGLGCTDCLAKPFHNDELLEKVNRLLEIETPTLAGIAG